MSTSPRARARPSIEVASAGSTIAGNSVTMSIRISELQETLGRLDHDPPRLQIHVAHDLGHCGHQVLARPVADDPQVLRRRRLYAQHATHLTPVLRQHAAALAATGRSVPRAAAAPPPRGPRAAVPSGPPPLPASRTPRWPPRAPGPAAVPSSPGTARGDHAPCPTARTRAGSRTARADR